MSKLFMYGTSLERIEQLMVMAPNFQPRRSGIVINNYFNCEGGVKDCNTSLINVSNSYFAHEYHSVNLENSIFDKNQLS